MFEGPTGTMPTRHKSAELACLKAKFTLYNLIVNHAVVSSWSADSRRAIAHESGSLIGFPKVA